MQLKSIQILILGGVILFQACSFKPQTRSISPHFNGQLTFGDKAISNAKVMLSIEAGDKYCLKAKTTTTTNKQGQFNLNAVTEEYTYLPFADQQLDEWNVCASYNDNIYSLYSNSHYGSGSAKGSTFLQCDLALNPINNLCSSSH